MKVSIYPTTDTSLTPFSYSILTAYNTCPTWGLVRYGMRKTFETSGRALALEAGAAMHRVFAALRLFSLRDKLPTHFEHHAHRIFGADAELLLSKLRTSSDDWINSTSFALEALHTSGYYDDPYDKKRTISNLEECALAYAKTVYSRSAPVWVQDIDNPESLVGIEVPFDFTIEFEYNDQTTLVRFIGTVDAIHQKFDGTVYIEENKTASRLDDSWAMSFELSHQVTGYLIAASLITGANIRDAVIRGVRIPQPRRHGEEGGIRSESVTRDQDETEHFLKWMLYTYQQQEETQGDIERAPRFTHSCNRYFRPCSLIPLCKTASPEERQEVLETMVVADVSPSEAALLEKALD